MLTSVLNEQSVPGVKKWLKTASVKGRICLIHGDLAKFVNSASDWRGKTARFPAFGSSPNFSRVVKTMSFKAFAKKKILTSFFFTERKGGKNILQLDISPSRASSAKSFFFFLLLLLLFFLRARMTHKTAHNTEIKKI